MKTFKELDKELEKERAERAKAAKHRADEMKTLADDIEDHFDGAAIVKQHGQHIRITTAAGKIMDVEYHANQSFSVVTASKSTSCQTERVLLEDIQDFILGKHD